MPKCEYCGKVYQRNSSHFREHVANCALLDKKPDPPKLLDNFTNDYMVKYVEEEKETEEKTEPEKIPEIKESEPDLQPREKPVENTKLIQPPAPKIDISNPIPKPQPDVGFNTLPAKVSDSAKLVYKGFYIGSVIAQNRLNGTIRGFDTRIYEKKEEYAGMIDEILAKRGLQLNVPVEVRFSSEVSMDLFNSFKDRIRDPVNLAKIPKIKRREEEIIREEKIESFRDVDSLFD